MRDSKTLVLAALVFAAAAGCNAVYVVEPIGLTAAPLDLEQWEGSWMAQGPDGGDLMEVSLTVVNESEGELDVNWTESEKNQTARVYLRQSGEWLFASTREEDDDEYVWARVTKSDDAIFFWMPDVEQFKKFVEQGKLPGEAEPLVLGTLEAAHYAFLNSSEAGVPFAWAKPGVLFRIE